MRRLRAVRMECKEPLGLGSIVLRVRHDLCVDCNRCAISQACPKDASASASRRPEPSSAGQA